VDVVLHNNRIHKDAETTPRLGCGALSSGGNMISGNSERPIKMYHLIDRLGKGYGWTKPEDGEEFWGIPYQWHGDNSMPFIEHRKNGFISQTVNVSDVSAIEFKL